MNKPKMILFDYGHTLLYEPDFDFVRGERALFQFITKNPDNLTPEQVCAFSDKLYGYVSSVRGLGMELHERQFQRMVYESLGIEFSISYEEAELVKWNAASPGAPMPDADRIVDTVNRLGIRSGVVSNIGWSEHALKSRIGALLPRNQFEFIIASSEYGFRKPSPYLFGLALRKAGLPPEDVWFCGDHPQTDIDGAAKAGIFPVWYDSGIECYYQTRSFVPPACKHLHIRAWSELIKILENLDRQE